MIAIEAPELLHLRELVETSLTELFAEREGTLWQAMSYGTLGGGKRMRGLLVLAACQAVSNQPETALPAAVAIELAHAFSLVHDDLPSLDNSPERRGQPSCHVVFGEPVALLAGDALLTEAFRSLVPLADIRLVDELATATGADGMCAGQVLDIQGTDDLDTLHRLKTGALFRASLRLGALAGGATPEQLATLTRVGEQIGLAFQIVDDLLDQGEDDGPSYVARYGAAEAQRVASQEIDGALNLLADWPDWANALRSLCQLVIDRTH